uniref:Cuticle protein 19 n=1 Tax=Anopheles melas TaxID=34690 RepID=A0A182UKB2_9DIPT
MTISSIVSSVMSVHLRMMSMTHSLHMSLEAVVLVGRVLNYSLSSVSLVQGVRSLDDISVPMFPLALVISGVGILYTVLELVARMRIVIVMAMMLRTVPISSSAPVLSRSSYSQTGDSQCDDLKIFVALAALVAVAAAVDDYYAYPSYKFEYGVKDAHTGDHKSQWEHRDGDVVKGAYTLHEADGTERVVEYSSDKHNGFQANVKRIF